MLLDVNLLLYAVNTGSAWQPDAAAWLVDRLNGDERVGMPWETLTAFLRLSTSPRLLAQPLTPTQAWSLVEGWLAVPIVWIPIATDRHSGVLGGLITKYHLSGKLIPDAHLAALAIQHGVDVYSTDTDFARFTEIRWVNPLAP